MQRPNLSVLTHALATRVVVEQGHAVGVEYVREGKTEQVRASRETILCGGAINSPHLLLLSGIGPAADLEKLGVKVALDLPGVGHNLQDHLAVANTYECLKPISLPTPEQPAHILHFLLFKQGPLTSNIAEAGAFVRALPGAQIPDVQFHFAPVYFMDNGFANPKGHGFTIATTQLYPRSRGQIALRATNPALPPLIQPCYLSDATDMRTQVEGIKLARRLAHTKAFEPYRGAEVWPGSAATSDAAIAEQIRRTAQTLYHPVGTCRMGNDRMAVVDNRLRVRGIEGLRVADASIMPMIIGGNTNAPTIMIGEKAADMIKSGR